MKIFINKNSLMVQTFPEPEDTTGWYTAEIGSLDDIEGKVFDPSTGRFVPDLERLEAESRQRRDELLTATDWVVIKSQETGQPVPPEWAAYRQALRDITDQPGFPLDVVWPTEPGGN